MVTAAAWAPLACGERQAVLVVRALTNHESGSSHQVAPEGTPNEASQPVGDAHTDASGWASAPAGREVVLRRTWPQRIVVVAAVAVILSASVVAWAVDRGHRGASGITRLSFESAETEPNSNGAQDPPANGLERVAFPLGEGPGQPLLQPDTPPGDPVNFLLVGTDSAFGLDPDDPILHGREVFEDGRAHADAIMLVRVDPASSSVWVLSIPRDLWAEIPRAQEGKVATALWIGGAPLLVETISNMFDVEINHYVQVDFAGFQTLVDALGGVPVWIPNPVRDPGSRLDIPTAGCHTLDGVQALQYVRSRRYTEQINGRWRITGGDDFARISRQQDFLVLALDRAIDQGARNPLTLTRLIEAGAEAVTLDQDLTLAELIELGEAFSDFDPENLHRQSLAVYTLFGPDETTYLGEKAYVRLNEPVLEVFRGNADAVKPSEVELALIGADQADVQDAATVLEGEGFVVTGTHRHTSPTPATVVMHGPGLAEEAYTVARYLDPVPHVVERVDLNSTVVALGEEYRGTLFLYQPLLEEVKAQAQARGTPATMPGVPADLLLPPKQAFDGEAAAELLEGVKVSIGLGTAVLSQDTNDDEEPTVGIQGRPPEGVSCE